MAGVFLDGACEDIKPDADSTRDIGTDTVRFANIYCDTLYASASGGGSGVSSSGVHTVTDYGAVADGDGAGGGTDDSTAIQNAIDAAEAVNGVVRFPPGTYRCDTALTVSPPLIIEADLVTLDFASLSSGGANNGLIEVVGTTLAAFGTSQSGDEVAGNKVWDFTASHGLAVGDVIQVRNTTNNSYSTYRTYYQKTERFVVREVVSATQVETTESARLAWTAAEATWTKYTSGEEFQLTGRLAIIGPGNATDGDYGLYLRELVFPVVSNVTVRGVDRTGIVLSQSYGGRLDNLHTMKEIDDGGAGLSYGLEISGCQDVRVTNSRLHGDRHGMTVGGTGLNIDIHAAHCIFTSNITYSADWHGNSIYCSYKDCDVRAGLAFGGNHNEVVGCTIGYNSTVACSVLPAECVGMSHRFVNNTVTGVTVGRVAFVALTFLQDDVTEGGCFVVDGLTVVGEYGTESGQAIVYDTWGPGPTQAIGYEISGVVYTYLDTVCDTPSISVKGTYGTTPSTISISNCRTPGGITASHAERVYVSNCHITNCSDWGIYSYLADKEIHISDCQVTLTDNTKNCVTAWTHATNGELVTVKDVTCSGPVLDIVYAEGADYVIIDGISHDNATIDGQVIDIRAAVGTTKVFNTDIGASNVAFAGTEHYLDVTGTGIPEGNCIASVGSIFRKTDEGGGIFVKQENDTNAGWVTPDALYNVKNYGATGDGSTDDGTAIQAAIDAAEAAGRGATVYFPPGEYAFSSTLSVEIGATSNRVPHIRCDGRLKYTGVKTQSALVIGEVGDYFFNAECHLRVVQSTLSDWTEADNIGIQIIRANNSDFYINEASNFTIGVELDGDGGSASYNNFHLGQILNNQYGIDLHPSNTGVVSENVFSGGRFQRSSGSNMGEEMWGLRIGRAAESACTNNVFYKPSFELKESEASADCHCVVLEKARDNHFLQFGDVGNDEIADMDVNCWRNHFVIGVTDRAATDIPGAFTDASSVGSTVEYSNAGMISALSTVAQIVHTMESGDTAVYSQWYNSATGRDGLNDGLTVGLDSTDAYVRNREAGSLYLGTNNANQITCTSTAVTLGVGLILPVDTSNVTTPTDAELDSAFGTPATVGAGFTGYIDDNGAGTAFYMCVSDGTNWWYQSLTKAT